MARDAILGHVSPAQVRESNVCAGMFANAAEAEIYNANIRREEKVCERHANRR